MFLVFLPGIQGTELYDQSPPPGTCDRIWPPHLISCPKTTSVPVSWLARKTLIPKQPIDEIDGCVHVYEPIDEVLKAAGYKDYGSFPNARHRKLAFGYDWRADLQVVASTLADTLDKVKFKADEEVVLLAHSMGGLICRLLLETGLFSNRPWFNRIHRVYFLSTPHLGTLEVLAKRLKITSIAGADGDAGVVFDDPAFPAGYQLLPHPSCFGPSSPVSAPLVVDAQGRAIDIYSPAGAAQLGLQPANLQKARDVWSLLDLAKKPAGVKYRSYVGSRMTTIQQIVFIPGASRAVRSDLGDAAVPDWSLRQPAITTHDFRGEHLHYLRRTDVKQALITQLAASQASVLEMAGAPIARMEEQRLDLQTDAMGYRPRDAIRISLFIHGQAPWGAPTEIDIERVEAMSTATEATPKFQHIAVGGLRTELQDDLRATLPAPSQPGAYRLAMKIKGRTVAVSPAFIVSRPEGAGEQPPEAEPAPAAVVLTESVRPRKSAPKKTAARPSRPRKKKAPAR